MDNTSKIFGWLLYFAGLGLVIAAFVLFLADMQEEKLFYLNMAFSCVIFTVAYFNVFDVFGLVSNVKASGSSMGITWVGSGIYMLLATALVVLSFVMPLGFNLCMYVHIALMFVLFIFIFMGLVVRNNVHDVERNIEVRKAGLTELNDKVSMLEIVCSTGSGRQYLGEVAGLKEELRFITASENRTAISIETRLSDKIALITSQIERGAQPSETVLAGFKDCKSLIELRKKQY